MCRNKNHLHRKIAVQFFPLCGHVQTASETTLKVSATNESVGAFKSAIRAYLPLALAFFFFFLGGGGGGVVKLFLASLQYWDFLACFP